MISAIAGLSALSSSPDAVSVSFSASPTDDARDVGERDCAKLLDNAFDGDAEARGAFGDLFDGQRAGISRSAARALPLGHLFNPDCCSVPESYHINPVLSSEKCTILNFSIACGAIRVRPRPR